MVEKVRFNTYTMTSATYIKDTYQGYLYKNDIVLLLFSEKKKKIKSFFFFFYKNMKTIYYYNYVEFSNSKSFFYIRIIEKFKISAQEKSAEDLTKFLAILEKKSEQKV